MKKVKLSIFVLSLFLTTSLLHAQDRWTAPEAANQLINPLADNQENINAGKKIFQSLCIACHGPKGAGDGVAAAGLTPKPTNFTTASFQAQTGGAIFWKLSKGKGAMAGYEKMLSENDRWAIVTYLKSLAPLTAKKKNDRLDNSQNPFLFTTLINSQSVQMLPAKSYEFTIQHRFGTTSLGSEFINNFLGMDLASNIRLGFSVALNNKFYVELGRTKFGKIYDFGAKYLLLQQTKDGAPLSIALYGDTGIRTGHFPEAPAGSTFSDGKPFAYKFAHRLSFNSQLIMARQFSNHLSLQLTPVIIWRNLAPENENNLTAALTAGGRWKLNYKSSILFEISSKFNTHDKVMPISLAYEIGSSAAHAFQLIITTTDKILEQTIYTTPVSNYAKGKFVIGFNIKRIF